MKRLLTLALLFLVYSLAPGQVIRSRCDTNVVANTAVTYTTGQAISTIDSLDLSLLPAGSYIWPLNLSMIDTAGKNPNFEVLYFKTRPTAPTNNAAFAPTPATMLKCVAVLPVATWYTYSGLGFADEPIYNRVIVRPKGRYLYFIVVSKSTAAYTHVKCLTLLTTFIY